MNLCPAFIAVSVALAATPAYADDGDVLKGLAYAKSTCAGCHAILASQADSPAVTAPPFEAIANTRGMTETALAVWFRTPHATMPNLIIQGEDVANVIAYIMSLRGKT